MGEVERLTKRIAELEAEIVRRPVWCPTCGGSGSDKRIKVQINGRVGYIPPMSCPECQGRGVIVAAPKQIVRWSRSAASTRLGCEEG